MWFVVIAAAAACIWSKYFLE